MTLPLEDPSPATLGLRNEVTFEATGICYAYGEHRVLSGVDLTVRRAEVLGLVGANGVGKSTLAQIMAGGLRADAGRATLHGQVFHPASPEEARDAGIGIIEQRFRLDPELTVAEALYRHTSRQDDVPADLTASARRLLIAAGIAIDPAEVLRDLSRSELGMVEAVRLLADPRPLTVIDEVSTAFNAREVDELHYILTRLTGAGRSAVYITHRMDEARLLCDRIAVMRDGRIVDVLDTETADIDRLSKAMFGHVIERSDYVSRATDVIALSVRGLDCGGGRPVAFDLRHGEVIGLLGARGDGVDQVIEALSGDAPHPEMELTLAGESARIDSPRAALDLRIAYHSSERPAGTLTADQIFARSMLIDSLSEGSDFDTEWTALAEIMAALRRSEDSSRALLSSGRLSGGQAQWARLREIVRLPSRLLLLDEPTWELDLQTKANLRELLAESTGKGQAVIVVSSDASDLLALTDRILVFGGGSVRAVWDSSVVTPADIQAVMRGASSVTSAEAVDALCEPDLVLTRRPAS